MCLASGVYSSLLEVDCMHIAQHLKQFQNVTAQNLSIILIKLCVHAYIKREEYFIKRVACVSGVIL